MSADQQRPTILEFAARIRAEQEAALAPKPAPAPAPVYQLRPAGGTDYTAAALAGEVQRVMDAAEGTRNHTLVKAAFKVGQLISGAGLDETHARAALHAAAIASGLDERETTRTLDSGIGGGKDSPRGVPERPQEALAEITPPPEVADGFWTARPILAHLKTFAEARMASPWAVLGVALVRVLATVPPHVVLPPTIGGTQPLNLYVGLVGPSGAGKGAAEAAGRDALDLGDIFTVQVGSGEGIPALYVHREKGAIVVDRVAVVASIPEIDTLGALGNRQGATLMPTLRSAWSGERLGFSYVDPTKRLPVEPGTYRLGAILGIQPDRAGQLLDDADGGTPQRFLWLPSTNPLRPDTEPPCPAPMTVTPVLWRGQMATLGGGRHITLPAEATDLIKSNRRAALTGSTEALDGHALNTRTRVAAALAILDGRDAVTVDDWHLSGTVMAMSDWTRSGVVSRLAAKAAKANDARAVAEGQRAAKVDEVKVERAVQRCAALLGKHIKEAGELPAHKAQKVLASRDRDYYDDAVTNLRAAGRVQVDEAPQGHVLRWIEGGR